MPESSNQRAKKRVGIVILAAGSSSRMGQPKQLLQIGGSPLVRRIALEAIGTGASPIMLVLGAFHKEIRPHVSALRVSIVMNPYWVNGMSSSIRSGLEAALEQSPDLEAIMITLADQPCVCSHHLGRLIEALNGPGLSIAASRYSDQLGTPAIFLRQHFAELLNLDGRAGAKQIITRHSSTVAAFDLPEAAIDIDTPSDLAAFHAKAHAHPLI